MGFNNNPHVAKASAAEQKATDATDESARAHCYVPHARPTSYNSRPMYATAAMMTRRLALDATHGGTVLRTGCQHVAAKSQNGNEYAKPIRTPAWTSLRYGLAGSA